MHIRTFPEPGTEPETLVGPVMTPGFINEFLFLDGTKNFPLNVPVTSGQQFHVSLEFEDPTDIGNGGPRTRTEQKSQASRTNSLRIQRLAKIATVIWAQRADQSGNGRSAKWEMPAAARTSIQTNAAATRPSVGLARPVRAEKDTILIF